MSEFSAAILGALIGAASAYWLARNDKLREEARRKRVLTSGLLIEVYWLSIAFDSLRRPWAGTRAVVEFPTTVHDQLVNSLEYLEPPTIYAVLELAGIVSDIVRMNSALSAGVADEDALRERIQGTAQIALQKTVAARDALLAEGAEFPQPQAPPSSEDVERHLARVRAMFRLPGLNEPGHR